MSASAGEGTGVGASVAARDRTTQQIAEQATLLAGVSGQLQQQAHALLEQHGLQDANALAVMALLEDFADYLNACADSLALEHEPVLLRELLLQAVAQANTMRLVSAVVPDLEVAADVPERVLTDPTRLMKMLSQLLGQSVRDSGSEPLVVKVAKASGTSISVMLCRLNGSVVRPRFIAGSEPPEAALRAALAQRLCALMSAVVTRDFEATEGFLLRIVVPLQASRDLAQTGQFRLAALSKAANAAGGVRSRRAADHAVAEGEGAIDFLYLDRQLGSLARLILLRTAPAFIASIEARMTSLVVALQSSDLVRLHDLAQAWKGSAMSVGGRLLAQLLGAMEKQCAGSQLPGEESMRQISLGVERLRQALVKFSREERVTPEFAITMQIGLRRILLVESERDQSIYWSELLGSLGFHVIPAASITEAKLLLADQPAIVVCSALLADGRGSDFIAQLRRREDLARVYLILLTNSLGHDELIESLTGGANDCMDKSASYSEVRARLKLAERVLTLNEALLDKSAKLSDAIRMIRNELESAARLHVAMLPRPLHEGALQIQTFYQPSDMLGGDMLGLTRLDEGQRIAFGLIDVAGHGTASALISCSLMREMMDRMRVLLENGTAAERCGQQVIEEMNRRYFQLDMSGKYFTAVAGVLDTRSWELSYCQAGHPSLMLYDPKLNWRVLEDTGFPVGLFEDAQYVTRDVQLTAGQKLLAISDGLLRPRPDDPGGGLAVLELLGQAPPHAPAIMQRLTELAASASIDERDDQSAMLICFGDVLSPG